MRRKWKRQKKTSVEFKNSIDDNIYLEVVDDDDDDNKRTREYQHIFIIN